jgi:N-glycosylase/DNA lyase
MEELIGIIEDLKNSEIKNIVNSRMKEFEELGKKESEDIFKELCFCLLTANFSASGGIKIQKEINDGFLVLPEPELAKRLSELGHRFPNARARFIFEARKYKSNIKEILNSFETESEIRNWLAKDVKGLGMKEASHFLRNIGYKNLAIIDFHILDLLEKHKLIEKPKTMSPKNYIEIENVLRQLAQRTNTKLGELDLYLWYKETGKILK